MTDADHIATLEERVRQLRTELRVEPERAVVTRLRVGLRLAEYPAVLLAVLYDAGSSWIPAERLNMALPERDHADPRDLRTIKVHIWRLRKALGRDAILCMVSRGYTLGAPGVLACKRILKTGLVA